MASDHPAIGDRLQISIETLTSEGCGLARADGFVVFTDDTCPGDEVLVEITEKKKSFARARLVELISPSNQRVTPACPVFGICGGCQLQHVEYQLQLEEKKKFVMQALRSVGLKSQMELVEDVIASPKSYAYRNRIQLHVFNNQVGFYRRRSHEIVPVSSCFIADHRISLEIEKLSMKPDGCYEVSVTSSGEILVRSREDELEFRQVNDDVNLLLGEYVGQNFVARPRVLDLFSGDGNLSLPLAAKYPHSQFHLIEGNKNAVLRARKSAPSNVLAIHSPVDVQLANYFNLRDTTVLVDPPRAGLSKTSIDLLSKLVPPQLVYISCDPATLARDLSAFIARGFLVDKLQPFDMFPQTSHIETVAVLNAK